MCASHSFRQDIPNEPHEAADFGMFCGQNQALIGACGHPNPTQQHVAPQESEGIGVGTEPHNECTMPTNVLTDHLCRTVKPTDKPQKLFDGYGLFLYVSPKGAKVWRMAYRVAGKAQTHVIGPYPLVSLADARTARDDVRRKLLAGESPKAPKKDANTLTFEQACDAYWSGRVDITDKYRTNATNGLSQHLYADIGAKPIGEVTRADLLASLLKMDEAGKLVYVRTVRMWALQVFEWAMEHGHCQINPAAMIKPEKAFRAPKKESHAALGLVEVPEFMARLSLERELQSVLACRLLAYTWVRTNELRMMLWSELEGMDGAWDLWRIPEGKMKRRVEHLIPLSRQAVEIIKTLKLRCQGSAYVFPAEHTIKRPMSENAVLYLLHRMGYKGAMTGHGWRSIGSTWANESGYNPDAIERQLAHNPADKTRAVYNRSAYLVQRREMLQAWADWLDAQSKQVDPGIPEG